jgi:DNA-binding XRE family transcriptional regulator
MSYLHFNLLGEVRKYASESGFQFNTAEEAQYALFAGWLLSQKYQTEFNSPLASYRRQRIEAGLRIKDVAEKTGLSASYLSLIERGKVKRPRIEVLQKLRAFYTPEDGQ